MSPTASFLVQHDARGEAVIKNDLVTMESIFDLSGSLGNSLINTAVNEILDCMHAESDADGDPWPSLGPTYKQWKDMVAPGTDIGELEGVMRDLNELGGQRYLQPDEAGVTYGVTDEARVHATRFQEGEVVTGWVNHMPRPFYYLGRRVASKVNQFLDSHFRSFDPKNRNPVGGRRRRRR